MAFLIDTDIIIYSLKGHEGVQNWMIRNQNIPKFISVITYGELLYGAKKSTFPEKNRATVSRVAELFPVIDLNKEIMEIFGELKAKLVTSGTVIEDFDLLIGSTAIYMNYSLVTNNKRHFQRINDLVVEDWEG
jgi:tRNA(fMet)-specific endonuclease VapC